MEQGDNIWKNIYKLVKTISFIYEIGIIYI